MPNSSSSWNNVDDHEQPGPKCCTGSFTTLPIAIFLLQIPILYVSPQENDVCSYCAQYNYSSVHNLCVQYLYSNYRSFYN